MGFLKPKMPTPVAPPRAPNPASTPTEVKLPEEQLGAAFGSLISTSARGLRRRASTQRTSLIGGG
jgi:hypothetical protein